MLDRVLPKNGPLRRRLRFLARKFNVSVTPRLKRRFTHVSADGARRLQDALGTHYYSDAVELSDPELPEHRRLDLENHLFGRLEIDRYEAIPWLNSVISLEGARVLEIGCGTGASTIAIAEQGARVTGLDLSGDSLEVAKVRAEVHGLDSTEFIEGNATEIGKLFKPGDFDLIVFFATLEHMTIEERKLALRGAWELSEKDGYLCVTGTPNRLWFYDSHTAHMPFFNWLPDDLAFEYSALSPRTPFNEMFRDQDAESMLRFIRAGRGMSFHEIDVALGAGAKYEVLSSKASFLSRNNPAKLCKRFLVGEGRREKLLNSYAQDRDRAFFQEYLDLIFRKLE